VNVNVVDGQVQPYCARHGMYQAGCSGCQEANREKANLDRALQDLYHSGSEDCKICAYVRRKYRL
jgi:hypothetical protein